MKTLAPQLTPFVRSDAVGSVDLLNDIHPGEVLMEEFITGFGSTQNKLAVANNVSPCRTTVDTALRTAMSFGASPEFWINLQYESLVERWNLTAIDAIPSAAVRMSETSAWLRRIRCAG